MIAGVRSIVYDIIYLVQNVASLNIVSIPADLALLGIQILSICGGLFFFAIGLGIFVGCIRKMHKRFFVKQYILRKTN